tara:strand:+ start:1676 stop:1879 length:204 start_codon:yes stop_codon:yes gene_type:complete
MPPEGYEDRRKKIVFYDWVYEIQQSEKQELTIKEQIKIANKKRLKAVKKENYLEAAKYRDIIENLKK